MIVCVCKSVSDRKLRAAIAEGMDTFDELQFEFGVALCCGKCEESVRAVMVQSGARASLCAQKNHERVQEAPLAFHERTAA